MDTRKLRRPTTCTRTRFEEQDADILGVRTRFVDVGPKDAPAVLLVHGLSSRIEEYEHLIERLSPTMRVLVPDLPGSGYSDKPDRVYSLGYLDNFLSAFLDTLSINQLSIAGGSLGGNMALRMAHHQPERFDRIVAWAPAGAWRPMKWLGRLARLPGRDFMFWSVLRFQSLFWYSRKWAPRQKTLDDAFRYYREVADIGFRRMYFDLLADQLENTHFSLAHKITQPTLLLYGSLDTGLSMNTNVPLLHAMIPKSILRVFHGARHSLASEVPDELSDEILAFCKK